MNTPTQASPTLDPRLKAFLAPKVCEVFHGVAKPNFLWQLDPYDVPTIHQEARRTFEQLVRRGQDNPSYGATLVLMGNAGSGKTHLLHALYSQTHAQQAGYCCYMQMTAEADNYSRYILWNVIDCLRNPYDGSPDSPTAIMRLARNLLDRVPHLTAEQRRMLSNGGNESLTLVDELADQICTLPAFARCDLDAVRALLHLNRQQPNIVGRVCQWLRCEEMKPLDRAMIGELASRTDEAEPAHMLRHLAKLIGVVEAKPLILLIDQLEDMFHQSTPVERYLKVIDSLVTLTEQAPNTIVVLACMEDYFKPNLAKLPIAKRDRLLHDPEPIRLAERRSLDEIRAIVARRLSVVYQQAQVTSPPNEELYPYLLTDFQPLENYLAREVLRLIGKHQRDCSINQRWEPPHWTPQPPPPPPTPELSALWAAQQAKVMGVTENTDEALAQMLAKAIHALSAELPDGVQVGCAGADGLYLEVDIQSPSPAPNKLLVAVCNRPTRGPALGRQIEALEKRVGDFPVAIVRTTDFPGGHTKAGKAIISVLKAHGRRVVVSDADWKTMRHFEEFRGQQQGHPAFAQWQKRERPLSKLKGLQDILRLNFTETLPAKPVAPILPPAPPLKPVEHQTPALEPVIEPEPTVVTVAVEKPLFFGQSTNLTATPITFEESDFTQHAAFLGGTGSGKTTAALNIIEQLLERGIPALLVDRKGDLCRYADPVAWNRSLNDTTRTTIRQTLRSRLDIAVYTPGEPTGRPLALPIVPAGFAQLPPSERERFAQYAASAMGSMLGFKQSNENDKAQLAILTNAINVLASTAVLEISLPNLRRVIREQDSALIDAIGEGYPGKHFESLAQRLHTLELNNRLLLQGNESLDIDALLGTGPHAQPGRTRLSIISTRFLGDAAKIDFWVAQLLVALTRWCARSPQPKLQAVLMFDEADMYLPAVRQPATKAPMEDLLKRARSAGVGVFLATQSPGDLDYKCKENIRSWFLGRIAQPQALEKLRPLFAGAKNDPTEKLANFNQGDFAVVRPANILMGKSQESLIRTEQLPEDLITKLASSHVQATKPRTEVVRSS